jgi:16S rRNA G966 N2-methylase RsmD
VYTGKTLAVLERVQADIVFLDPPYEKETEYELALTALGASTSKLVIAQHASRATLNPEYGTLRRYRILKQGDNSLSFYQT